MFNLITEIEYEDATIPTFMRSVDVYGIKEFVNN